VEDLKRIAIQEFQVADILFWENYSSIRKMMTILAILKHGENSNDNLYGYGNDSFFSYKNFIFDPYHPILPELIPYYNAFYHTFINPYGPCKVHISEKCRQKMCDRFYYKNQTEISNSDFFTLINNDKYKISTDLYKIFERRGYGSFDLNNLDSSYYLSSACDSGNEAAVKYLLKHGVDINKDYIFGMTPLFNACHSGNLKLVKYLVVHGANINK